jgi:hypothetical protein
MPNKPSTSKSVAKRFPGKSHLLQPTEPYREKLELMTMPFLGLKDAFGQYGATLRNVQWSVSAWTPNGDLVLSLWEHHRRKPIPGTLEFADSVERWKGPGNNEFRANLASAFASGSNVRLVIVHTEHTEHVESGADASKVKKDFSVRTDLIGKVVEWDGNNYAVRFIKV